MGVTLLKIRALPKRIDPEERVEIQYSCTKHGGFGTIRLTNDQWRNIANNLIAGHFCAKCAEGEYKTPRNGTRSGASVGRV